VPVDVHVVTPERELWSGSATTVIARGVAGEVGILAGHMPLLVQLSIGPLRILRDDGPELLAVVDGGFLHVTSSGDEGTRVDVMASQAEFVEEIDVAAAQARADQLEAQLAEGRDTEVAEAEILSMKAELQKALVRVSVAG
jgi:F-type H+-transporting ATPase subunit epsilon